MLNNNIMKSSTFSLLYGNCTVKNGCLSSPLYPNPDEVSTECLAEVTQEAGTMEVLFFDVGDFGTLEIDNIDYTQTTIPNTIDLHISDQIYYYFDSNFTYDDDYLTLDSRFSICWKNVNMNQGGGGIYIEAGITTISQGTLLNNMASVYGGGIYINGGVNIMKDNTSLTNNDAEEGAQIYISGGTLESNGLTIDPSYQANDIAGESAQSVICESSCSIGQSGSCSMIPESASQCYVNWKCSECMAGTYSSSSGSTSNCSTCSLGKASSNNASACTTCIPGKYASNNEGNNDGGLSIQIVTGASICQNCPIGYYSEYSAAIVCQACSENKLSNPEGANSSKLCNQAVEGYYILNDLVNDCPENTDCLVILVSPFRMTIIGVIEVKLSIYWTLYGVLEKLVLNNDI
mmetsp:Transcript_30960/g.39863  ORF Transcript_30960/g.39863 Transcript_30960/m.39863 type:complete len:404 (+) Transcript_30960:2-1213(+)